MSPVSRREKIEKMLAEEPGDIFLRYSLALELEKEGSHERSLELLTGLSRESPPYVAAFFMAGQLLVRLNRVEEARSILRDGIEAARSQANEHAAGEMSEFLAGLGNAGP
jgi:thioredoxin-like negative regulator of GroEL